LQCRRKKQAAGGIQKRETSFPHPLLLLTFTIQFHTFPSTASPIFQYYHHLSAQHSASHADSLISKLSHHIKSHPPLLPSPLDSRPDIMAYEYRAPGPDTYSADKAQQGHSDEYPCTICSEHFSANNSRAAHMRTLHGESRIWLCRECPKAFAVQKEYELHGDEHAGTKGKKKGVECDVCNFSHRSAEVMRRHMAFDHAKDGSHVSQCGECKYQNDSCCGVFLHTLHMHPGRTVPLPKPTGLATPPVTPPERQPPADSPASNKINPEHDAYLRDQEARYLAMSQEERNLFKMRSRNRKRAEKAAAEAAGRPAPGSS
jgi:hypothetical protein